jgi:hypothetical protein
MESDLVKELTDTAEHEEVEKNTTSYINHLKLCYNTLKKSRLVNHRDTDLEALEYFQNWCNTSSPRSREEAEVKRAVRELYNANKTSFLQCVAILPYYILLTDTRSIVLHFGIHKLAFIKWEDGKYIVEKNNLHTSRQVKGNINHKVIAKIRRPEIPKKAEKESITVVKILKSPKKEIDTKNIFNNLSKDSLKMNWGDMSDEEI